MHAPSLPTHQVACYCQEGDACIGQRAICQGNEGEACSELFNQPDATATKALHASGIEAHANAMKALHA